MEMQLLNDQVVNATNRIRRPPVRNRTPVASSTYVDSLPAQRQRLPDLMSVEDLDCLPEFAWLVEGWLPQNGLAVLYGAPARGKSFLAFDLSFSIASGQDLWFGAKMRRGPVVYVAGEG